MPKRPEVPYNAEAESAALGAAMLSMNAAAIVLAQTTPADFWVPRHRTVRVAIEEAYNLGHEPPDVVSVAAVLRNAGTLDEIGGGAALNDLVGSVGGLSLVGNYVRSVIDASTKRGLLAASAEIAEIARNEADSAVAVDRAEAVVRDVLRPMLVASPSPTIDDVLSSTVTYDWVVRGLLERGDRLILTGGEGGGKSTFLRQFAVALAAGRHPFTFQTRTPFARVLYVDCENGSTQIRRKFKTLHASVSHDIDPSCLRIEERPGGIDLMTRRDANWLIERVASNRPDVLIIGPIYKLHDGDPNAEEPAKKVQRVLDDARTAYDGCALIMEAHSPHGREGTRDLRPIGASAWMRWPEFGFGIRPDKRNRDLFWFDSWRGPRDEREWPRALQRGGLWPWTPTTPPRSDAPVEADDPAYSRL